jgi:hypothetical protein
MTGVALDPNHPLTDHGDYRMIQNRAAARATGFYIISCRQLLQAHA